MKKLGYIIRLAISACILFPSAFIIGAKWVIRGLRSGWSISEMQTEYEHEFDELSSKIKKLIF